MEVIYFQFKPQIILKGVENTLFKKMVEAFKSLILSCLLILVPPEFCLRLCFPMLMFCYRKIHIQI